MFFYKKIWWCSRIGNHHRMHGRGGEVDGCIMHRVHTSINKGNNVCLSVCVGSAWKILLVTAHTDKQTDIVQGWPPVLPPLYGQVWSVFFIWTGNGWPTNTVQGWPPMLPPPLWTGNGQPAGGRGNMGGVGRVGKDRAGGPTRAGKDRRVHYALGSH